MRSYVEERFRLLEREREEKEIQTQCDQLYTEVCKCELLGLLHLVNLCLYNETVAAPAVDRFDFVGQAIVSWRAYKDRKDKYLALS